MPALGLPKKSTKVVAGVSYLVFAASHGNAAHDAPTVSNGH
jgi:hypothetical protein